MNKYAVVVIYRDSAGVLQVGQCTVPDYEQAEIYVESYPNVISVIILPWRLTFPSDSQTKEE